MADASFLVDCQRDFAHINDAIIQVATALETTYFVGPDVFYEPTQTPPFQSDTFASFQHAAQIALPDSEINLICTAKITSATFWAFVSEKLELDEQIRPVKDQLVLKFSQVKLLRAFNIPRYRSTKLRLSYQKSPQGFESIAFACNLHALSFKAYEPLQRIVETERLLRDVYARRSESQQSCFRNGFFRLYQWADSCGLVSDMLHMLTAECLFVLYATGLEETSPLHGITENDEKSDESVPELDYLRQIFAKGSFHDFFTEDPEVLDRFTMTVSPPYSRHNFAANLSPEATRSFKSAIDQVSRLLWLEDTFTLIDSPKAGLQLFLENSQQLVLFTARCWDVKLHALFLEYLPVVLLQFQSRFRARQKGVHEARLWPNPLPTGTDGSDGDSVYLFDIYHTSEDIESDNNNNASGHDVAELPSCLEEICDGLDYNREIMYMELSLASVSEIQTSLTTAQQSQPSSSSFTKPSVQDQAGAVLSSSTPPSSSPSSKKFRPFSSALSRLRWDPQHREIVYEVGYIDRFPTASADTDGLLWKPLDTWQKHTEEEDFVPEHRVRKIRKVGDGEAKTVVWDRERRIDGT
jgi:uncharacterized protein (UPF0248 family)